MKALPPVKRLRAVFDPPTEETCCLNYAEGARCGRLKKHEGPCSQVSRWVMPESPDSGEMRGRQDVLTPFTPFTPFTPASPATVSDILHRYATWLATQDTEVRGAHAHEINTYLDQLLRDDAFGTEGQCDPRGDYRS
jgi:hypothetical protein